MWRIMALPMLVAAMGAGTMPCAAGEALSVDATPAPTAGQPSTPLTLDEVLQSSARSAPDIIAALARARQAEGRAISAQGAFASPLPAT